jgi:hypothetical protein
MTPWQKFTQRRAGTMVPERKVEEARTCLSDVCDTTKENTREKEHHLSFRSGTSGSRDDGAGQRGTGSIRTELELVDNHGANYGAYECQ